MRYPSTLAAIVLTCVGTLSASAEPANLLLNGGAEQGKGDQPSIWSAASVAAPELKMTRDTSTSHDGKASLSIANAHKYDQPTANNWMQPLQSVPAGKTVVVSGWIKTADADAANVCLQCWDATGKEMVGFTSTPVVRGDQEWTLLKSAPLVVPAATKSVIVRAALSGTGQAWFDDLAVVEVAETASTGPGASSTPGAAAPDAAPDAAPAGPFTPDRPASVDDELRKAVGGEIVGTMPVTRDQMILSYLPDWSHGRVDNIAVANNEGGVRTLLAWPRLAEVAPEGHRFVLACYSRETTAPPAEKPGKIGAYEVLGDWDEQTSWVKQPKVADAPIAEAEVVAGRRWVTFDVTPIVRKQLAGGAAVPNGVLVRFQREDAKGSWSGYAFVSREGEGKWQAKRPLLLVVKE